VAAHHAAHHGLRVEGVGGHVSCLRPSRWPSSGRQGGFFALFVPGGVVAAHHGAHHEGGGGHAFLLSQRPSSGR
jgi:hypothetical protein